MKSGLGWVYDPNRALKAKAVPPAARIAADEAANQAIETILKPKCVKPMPKHVEHNWVINIHVTWRGSYLYFIKTFYCPFKNRLSEQFEAKEARMQYLSNGNYSISYMRHTGQWWPLGVVPI